MNDWVLVDTCVWAPFLNHPQLRQDSPLAQLLEDDRVAIVGPILQEILIGIRRKEQADWIASQLEGVHWIDLIREDGSKPRISDEISPKLNENCRRPICRPPQSRSEPIAKYTRRILISIRSRTCAASPRINRALPSRKHTPRLPPPPGSGAARGGPPG